MQVTSNKPQLGKRKARSALVVGIEAGDALLEQPVHLRQLLSMWLGSCSSKTHRSGIRLACGNQHALAAVWQAEVGILYQKCMRLRLISCTAHFCFSSVTKGLSGRAQECSADMLWDGRRTLLHSVALEQLYLALVHDLAHADAQDLHIVILRIDARLLQQQTALISTESTIQDSPNCATTTSALERASLAQQELRMNQKISQPGRLLMASLSMVDSQALS